MYRSGRTAVAIPVISPGLRPMRAQLRPLRGVFPAQGVIARFTARESFALSLRQTELSPWLSPWLQGRLAPLAAAAWPGAPGVRPLRADRRARGAPGRPHETS